MCGDARKREREYKRDYTIYNLNWVVCHLFPQQRWRTHTNNQSRKTIGQENYVTCVKLRPRLNFVPRFLEPIPRHVFSINTSSSNILSLFPNFYCSANTLSPVWLTYSPTDVKSHKMDKPHRHSFLQNTLTMRLSSLGNTDCFKPQEEMDILKYVINLNRMLSLHWFTKKLRQAQKYPFLPNLRVLNSKLKSVFTHHL